MIDIVDKKYVNNRILRVGSCYSEYCKESTMNRVKTLAHIRCMVLQDSIDCSYVADAIAHKYITLAGFKRMMHRALRDIVIKVSKDIPNWETRL